MAVEKIHIEQFLSLARQHPVIDVRSPAEYKHAHLPGATNLPLFSDEERAAVGTAYKQESREKAIKLGLDYFGPKMKKMVEEAESIVQHKESEAGNTSSKSPGSRQILLYCWRGGMRSGALSWLLDLYGFRVYTLAGGYKKFRNHVLDTFKIPGRFAILGGYTGSGKTGVLHELEKKGNTVVNLEAIANHKGSAFGNIGMPVQPSQEMFENILGCRLRDAGFGDPENMIWLEDESQRIGLVNIPTDLWKTMRQSPVFFLEIPFEERLKHLVAEYGGLDRQKMIDAIGRIRERLGGLEARNAIQHLESGNTIESFRILLAYYDKWYLRALHNRDNINSLLKTIPCNSVTTENANRLTGQFQYDEKT